MYLFFIKRNNIYFREIQQSRKFYFPFIRLLFDLLIR